MAGKVSRLKFFFFWVLALVPVAIAAETVSYLLIIHAVPSRTLTRLGRGTIEAHLQACNGRSTEVAQVLQCAGRLQAPESPDESRELMFHPVLGWDYPPGLVYRDIDGVTYSHGPDGARRTCTSFGSASIRTYGDSFTYCANVQDEQTWQTYLGRKLGVNVLNYGVGGYGTDQAYLKYELNSSTDARIVMLGIFPENINRVVNIFRPFYVHEAPWGLTKPMFQKTADGFKLIPNPLDSVPDIVKLQNPDFLRKLGEVDYWYLLDQRMPEVQFPYALSIYRWRAAVFRHLPEPVRNALHLASGAAIGSDLLEDPETLSVMCHIADLFVRTAKSRGAIPIIVIIPHKDYVREVIEGRVSRTDGLVGYLSRMDYPHIDAIRAVAEMKPNRSELDDWYQGHATAQGNKVLADIIYSYVTANYGHVLRSEEDRSVARLSHGGAASLEH